MTTVLLLLTLAGLGTSPAAARTPATLYVCEGEGVTVTYSMAKSPKITYQFREAVVTRSGDDVSTQDSVLGSLVTIVTRSIPDLLTESLTLVAPNVNLTKRASQATFVTRYFATQSNTTIGGPDLVAGMLEESTSRRLVCTATAPRRSPS